MDPYKFVTLTVYKQNQIDQLGSMGPFGSICILSELQTYKGPFVYCLSELQTHKGPFGAYKYPSTWGLELSQGRRTPGVPGPQFETNDQQTNPHACRFMCVACCYMVGQQIAMLQCIISSVQLHHFHSPCLGHVNVKNMLQTPEK